MIAAQKEAGEKLKLKSDQSNDQIISSASSSTTSASSSIGFKKGFFSAVSTKQSSSTKTNVKEDVIDINAKFTASTGKAAVLESVQKALREENKKAEEESKAKYGPLEQFLSKNGMTFSYSHFILR